MSTSPHTRNPSGPPACQGCHALPLSVPENLRWLVEIDRRRGSIGLHVATDPTKPARSSSSLWLDPDRAEALAQSILEAVGDWRQDATVAAWTLPVTAGGAQ